MSPQQEATLDDIPIEQVEKQPTKADSSCQVRLAELKQRICTFGDNERPGQEFWDSLYRLCQDLEEDLDKVL